jgi:hypothetical protein
MNDYEIQNLGVNDFVGGKETFEKKNKQVASLPSLEEYERRLIALWLHSQYDDLQGSDRLRIAKIAKNSNTYVAKAIKGLKIQTEAGVVDVDGLLRTGKVLILVSLKLAGVDLTCPDRFEAATGLSLQLANKIWNEVLKLAADNADISGLAAVQAYNHAMPQLQLLKAAGEGNLDACKFLERMSLEYEKIRAKAKTEESLTELIRDRVSQVIDVDCLGNLGNE